MNRAQRWRLIIAASACAGALALAAVAVLLFDAASDGDSGPSVGDHWHAPYDINIGGTLQPPIPETITPQGIHTHGDGVIHVHPHITAAEGSGARLTQFFGDMGGSLTEKAMRIPGTSETYREGDLVGGRPAELRILRADSGIHPLGAGFAEAIDVCQALPESAFEEVTPLYVVRDGDCVRIIFGEIES
jgi:hypothetical protein